MYLGDRVQITIGVEDVENSAEFFISLGFQEIERSAEPYPWVQISDGQNLILLNQDGMVYRGLVFFNSDLDNLVQQMEADGVTFFWKQPNEDGTLANAMFIDPNGAYGEEKNLGINIVGRAAEELHQPAGEPLTLCGKFGELCSSTADFAAAKAYWSKLGFEQAYGGEEPYPYGVLQAGPMLLGFHQTPLEMTIPSPALTYFSADSADRIARIKSLGHLPTFEMTGADGETITHAGFEAPGGQHIYVFNGAI